MVSRRAVLAMVAQTGRDAFAGRDPFAGARAGEEREMAGLKLCWCPPGRFRMGSPADEPNHRADEAQVDVTISRGFWAGKFEVTQGQWTRLMGEFPRAQNFGAGDEFPVYWVSFLQAGEFSRKLTASAREGGGLPKAWAFRLPTEAEWEYACRAGTTAVTAFGDSLRHTQANFQSQPYNGGAEGPVLTRASKVGSYAANAWGLHDFHGNVWEYCRDWYHARLPGGADPDLYETKGQMNRDGTYSRVRRGGAWIEQGWTCRSAMRLRYEPERSSDHIGFRVVVARA